MRIRPNAARFIEHGLLLSGLVLLITFSLAHVHRLLMFRAEMDGFERRKLESVERQGTGQIAAEIQSNISRTAKTMKAGDSPWSVQSANLGEASVPKPAEAVAVLRIRRLHLEVPVLEGTDGFTLNRGVGIIAGTSHPGQSGNIGIAGHRDGFFRVLKDIKAADLIELVTTSGTDVYAVDRVRITDPADVGVLQDKAKPSLTLVTCYPFYFVGPAPTRYIVEASLKQ